MGQPSTHLGLIGLDWGTTALRAYRMDATGHVLDMQHRPWGIMNLPPGPDGSSTDRHAAFERALQDTCGAWLHAEPALPLLACGMVGSAQGWLEAPYQNAPASCEALAANMSRIERGTGSALHIVPGLIQHGDLPNVMRGEETQVLGILAGRSALETRAVLMGLPGTHSKWVLADQNGVVRFDTFMTGEVFAALCGHTILGRTMHTAPANAKDASAPGASASTEAAFLRGLQVAQSGDADLGVLSNIFSTRTLGLTGVLPATEQADYLSGVLIGHEVASLARRYTAAGGVSALPVVLCGEPDLCRRYALALGVYGFSPPDTAPQATASGLWQIAVAAGLVHAANNPGSSR